MYPHGVVNSFAHSVHFLRPRDGTGEPKVEELGGEGCMGGIGIINYAICGDGYVDVVITTALNTNAVCAEVITHQKESLNTAPGKSPPKGERKGGGISVGSV